MKSTIIQWTFFSLAACLLVYGLVNFIINAVKAYRLQNTSNDPAFDEVENLWLYLGVMFVGKLLFSIGTMIKK